ncbi:hypothetical protein ScPMuIL_004834 [Solemya velum]
MDAVVKNASHVPVKYVDSLDKYCQSRYLEKCGFISGRDPYDIKKDEWSNKDYLWPFVTHMDIIMYLIYTKSGYTVDELRTYKSLEAYNQFVSGWVSEVSIFVYKDVHVCKAQVLHSQKLSEKVLNPWILAEKSGKIICAL